MLTLVRFSCGCIGTVPVDRKSLIVNACDKDYASNEMCFHESERVADKKYESLPEPERDAIVKELGKLVGEGYGLRQIRLILK